jgi:hypothetical protein
MTVEEGHRSHDGRASDREDELGRREDRESRVSGVLGAWKTVKGWTTGRRGEETYHGIDKEQDASRNA